MRLRRARGLDLVKILERYVAVEILKTLLFSLVVFTAVFFIGAVYMLFNRGVPLRQIPHVLPYALLYSMPFLMPICLLVGCALGYGRLTADNEIVPISTAGVHLWAIVAPAVALGALMTGLLFGLESTFVPHWNYMQRNLKKAFVDDLLTLGNGADKRVPGPDFNLYIQSYHGAELEGVELVYRHPAGFSGPGGLLGADGGHGARMSDDDVRPVEIAARSGEVRPDPARDALVLTIRDATMTIFKPPPGADAKQARGAPQVSTFSEATFVIPNQYDGNRGRLSFQSSKSLAALRARLLQWRAFETRPAWEREAAVAAASSAGLLALPGAPVGAILGAAELAQALPSAIQVLVYESKINDIDEDLYERMTLAAAPLVFSLIGAGVPLLLRHNNRLVPFFVAFALVGLTYFLPFFTARSLVDGGKLTASVAFSPIIAITLACGVGLLWRVFRR